MFLDFFLLLKNQKVPVSLSEWLTLMSALDRGHGKASLASFYSLARTICIKHEKYYDDYDRCFAHFFYDEALAKNPDIGEEFHHWLKTAELPELPEEWGKKTFQTWDRDRLLDELEKRLQEQKERHDGGSKWVGTGGTSPFGHSGYHPEGIRVGGMSRHGRAIQVAAKRKFANLRNDQILDTRQMSLALRQLRVLGHIGSQDELNLPETVRATSQAAGDIDLVFQASKKNTVKLLMLSDVGGSMTAFAKLCETLFSAASGASHFKAFAHYYFHNCPYETLYTDMSREQTIPTKDILKTYNSDWTVFIVGDAYMSPYELLVPGGSVDYHHHNEIPGIEWLNMFRRRFPASAWLNPIPNNYWYGESISLVRDVFPMFPLTVEGIFEAAKMLRNIQQRRK